MYKLKETFSMCKKDIKNFATKGNIYLIYKSHEKAFILNTAQEIICLNEKEYKECFEDMQ